MNIPNDDAHAKPRWKIEEIKFLKQNYAALSNAAIGVALGRSAAQVCFKAFRLGLSKSKKRLREMGQENIAQRWH